MDTKQAQGVVRDTLQNTFDKARFTYFVKELLNHIDESPFIYRGNLIPDAYEKFITTFERIGKYTDGESKIDILVVNLKKETSIERARAMQRNFIAWYLNGSRGGELKDAALVAFVSPNQDDWRFSLVKMDYRFEEGKSGKMRVKEEFTPARRWSFLVGKNENSHTAQSKLAPVIENEGVINLEQLEEAFNIEVVTKEFFEKYRELFHLVEEHIDEIIKKDGKIKAEFKERKITSVDFAKKLLGQIVFLYFLQKKGWFGVARDADWGTGPKNFLRLLLEQKIVKYDCFFNDILEPLFYEALNKERDGDFYSKLSCKIPFLNGELFDPIKEYDWIHTDILLSDDIFSNKERTKQGDIGTGILDVFDRYNFTVKEDEPLEKDVAIDPEMLGKVFENLLEVKDRKSKGTYYTPREIVHYMCQESLINYLKTECKDKVSEEDIRFLIQFGESAVEHEAFIRQKGKETPTYSYKLPESIRKNAKLIDNGLASIRVCDPAIGSGAFPVGMMNEVIRTRNALTNFISNKEGRTVYEFKRHAIQYCIYGVDIDLAAVEIAKLRLWLSLVVDEDDIKKIKPLPNLDFKIVQGNSLLGVEKNLFNAELFKELESLKPVYFDETNLKKKYGYKKRIDELIKEISNNNNDFDFEVYFSEVFHEAGGFGIVIANPPYDVYEGNKKGEIEEIRNYPIYEKATGGKLNAYKLFLAKSIELQKPRGILCEIFQNSFLADNSASKIRKYFLQNQRIFRIDSFPERDDSRLRVFENVKMSVCILLSQNDVVREYEFFLRVWRDRYMSTGRKVLFSNLDILTLNPNSAAIPLVDQKEMGILRDILKNTRLESFARCYEGEINLTFHKKFLRKEKYGNTKMIKGAAVQKWFTKDKMSQGEIEYLDSVKYLKENTSNKSQHFNLERIVMQGITGIDEKNRLKMAIIGPGIFCGNSVNYILVQDKTISNKYLLALLNSRLLNWFFVKFSTNSNVNGYEVDNLPIPRILPVKQGAFIEIADKILLITSSSDYLENKREQAMVADYEKQIDQLVYKLYGLKKEEIKIIESFGK